MIEPCSVRINNVEEFLEDIDPSIEYNVLPIYDMYGPTVHNPTFQVIINPALYFIVNYVGLVFLKKILYFR